MAVLPDFDPDAFTNGAPIDNEFHPLIAGTIKSLGGTVVDEETGEKTVERNDIMATFATKDILGVETTVVRDTEYVDGVIAEDTIDWFAQDDAGNVWYFGELTFAFEYDDEGTWIGTDFGGSWEANGDDIHPGHIMPAEPGFGPAYCQEFAPRVAEDEAIVVGVDESIPRFGGGVLKTLDTTALDAEAIEYKYYKTDVGMVLEEQLDTEGNVVAAHRLLGVQTVGPADGNGAAAMGRAAVQRGRPVDELSKDDFIGDGSAIAVTFEGERGRLNNAVGVYTFDEEGTIGQGRIIFAGTEDLEEGTTVSIDVAADEGLGLFLIPDVDNLGIDLTEFADGGLFFTNFVTGEAAKLDDGLAPLVATDPRVDFRAAARRAVYFEPGV